MKRLLLLVLFFYAGLSRAADVAISALPAAGSVTGSMLTVIVDTSNPSPSAQTQKATVAQLIGGLPLATGGSNGIISAADKAKLDAAASTNTASTLVLRDSSGNFSAGAITATSVTGLSNPVNPGDAANKAYVDAAAAGLVIKTPAVAATAGSNVTLAGGAPNTLDGVTLHLNDRVLVKNQTDDTQNGIYYVSTLGTGANGTWTRTTDADTGAKLVTGSYVFVTGGTTNVNSSWTMVTPGTITIGTSHITWNLFSQVTQILASNIIGQIVNSQVQDGAINTAKFALSIAPVSIVATLPSPSGYTGPTVVFNQADGKLYRYVSGAFTAAVPTTDLNGTITNTQIADNSISTPKLQANSISAGKIAAGAVVAGDLAANAVTAGTIAAAAVSTTELAAGAVNASKIAAGSITTAQIAASTITAGNIQAGTITADRLNITSLSAITANIGTITSGTLTSSISISVGSGTYATNLSPTGLTIAGGKIDLRGDGTNPYVRVYGSGSYASQYVEMNAQNGALPPFFQTNDGTGNQVFITPGALNMNGSTVINLGSSSFINGPGTIRMNSGDGQTVNVAGGEVGSSGSQIGYWSLKLNGRTVLVPIYNP